MGLSNYDGVTLPPHPLDEPEAYKPPAELQQEWEAAMEPEIRDLAAEVTFHLWMRELRLAHRDGPALTVMAPEHTITLLRDRYLPTIELAARRVYGNFATVELVREGWSPPPGAAPAPLEPSAIAKSVSSTAAPDKLRDRPENDAKRESPPPSPMRRRGRAASPPASQHVVPIDENGTLHPNPPAQVQDPYDGAFNVVTRSEALEPSPAPARRRRSDVKPRYD